METMWAQAREILDSVLQLPAGQRSQYLDKVCPQGQLREYVEGLIASYDQATGFLEHPALESALPTREMCESWVGRRIGPYRLEQEIGHGGMGSVFRASRADDEYQQQVAIKLIREGFASNFAVARFKAERQILARLEHPNIARLLDGGRTEHGFPYLVMELVHGKPIDQYCEQNHLSLRERLLLFRTVCGAVQYAHQNLIIHRDLKPGNIFVTNDGVPKLLDFGIAKLLSSDGLASEETATLLRILTPEYASPEQVRGDSVNTATDVYSLGVVLYVLLTGRGPFQLNGLSMQAIAKVVCEAEPAKPSEAVRRTEKLVGEHGDSPMVRPEPVSATHGEKPDKLHRLLAGDLDNIVLKTLNKEPERRYLSMEEFSADIERYLDRQPVRARKNSMAYRMGKLAHRNAATFLAVCLLVLTLTGAVGLVFWQIHSGKNVRSIIPIRTRPSVAVLGFTNLSSDSQFAWLSTALSEMISTELAAGEKLRTIPGERLARMKTELSLKDVTGYSPEQIAAIHKNIGSDFVVMGWYLPTSTGHEQSIRLDVRVQDGVSGETIGSISETGMPSDMATLVSRTGNGLRQLLGLGPSAGEDAAVSTAVMPSRPEALRYYAEGLQRLRQSDAITARKLLEQAVSAEPAYAPSHEALAGAWLTLGYEAKAAVEAKRAFDLSAQLPREEQLRIEAQYRQTTHQWEKTIEIYKSLSNFFPDNLDYGLRLSEVQISAGKGNDALRDLEQLRKLPPPAGADAGIDLSEALAAQSVSDYQREKTAANEAIQKGKAAGRRLLVAKALLAESVALRHFRDFKLAVATAHEAQQIYVDTGDRAGQAASLNALGNTIYDTGQMEEAKQDFAEAATIYREIGNKRGEAGAMDNLANVIGDQGDIDGARHLSEGALAIFREIGYKKGIANVSNNIAGDMILQGDLRGAIAMLQETLAIRRELDEHDETATCLDNLGAAQLAKGDLAASKASFEEAVQIRRSIGQIKATADLLEGLGEVALASGDLASARANLNDALAITRASGEKHISAMALHAMAGILFEENRLDEAKETYKQAVKICTDLGEKGNAGETKLALANLLLQTGDPTEARALAGDALAEFKTEKLLDDEMMAHTTIADTLLADGKVHAAGEELALAEKRASTTQSLRAAVELQIVRARWLAASHRTNEALQVLHNSVSDSRQHGFLELEFKARLALARTELAAGKNPAAQRRSQELRDDAAQRGFSFIVEQASRVNLQT